MKLDLIEEILHARTSISSLQSRLREFVSRLENLICCRCLMLDINLICLEMIIKLSSLFSIAFLVLCNVK